MIIKLILMLTLLKIIKSLKLSYTTYIKRLNITSCNIILLNSWVKLLVIYLTIIIRLLKYREEQII